MDLVCAGIDVGGTNTEIGLVDKNGYIHFSKTISTRRFPEPEKFIHAAAEVIREGLDLSDTLLRAVGMGAPSANYYSGSVEFAPNIPWEGKIALAEMMKKESGVMCFLTNDANAAAVGEQLFGAAKGLRDFVVVTLGTGLGSGFVVNDQVVYGSDGFAGELGHVIVERNGRLCGCTRRGCLETYVSATGIVNTAKEWLDAKADPSSLREIPVGELDAKMIAFAASEGDQFALKLMDFTAEKLGFALANMVAITSPSHIFLYGGLAKAGDLILLRTRKYYEQYVLRNYKGKVQILLSALPENAAVLGAAALAWKETG